MKLTFLKSTVTALVFCSLVFAEPNPQDKVNITGYVKDADVHCLATKMEDLK